MDLRAGRRVSDRAKVRPFWATLVRVDTRSLSFVLIAILAGCVSLDGLTSQAEGDGEEAGAPVPSPPASDLGCEAPGAPKCEHGRCVEASEGARCECDEGWVGSTCAECAVGAACEAPTCDAVTCPDHAACDDSSGTARCSCVVGYAASDGTCKWSGVVKDPGFREDPPGAWKLSGGASLDPTATGYKDPGIVELATTTCDARVEQSVVMPPLDRAEPLALAVWGSGRCGSGALKNPCKEPFSLRVAGYSVEAPIATAAYDTPTQGQVCLGERAFDGELPIDVVPTSCGIGVTSLALDHVDIVPAPACPSLGEIPNADFEGLDGWVSSDGAEIAPVVGSQGSRGGRLHRATGCEKPKLTGKMSVPLSDTALTFMVNGTESKRMTVTANDVLIGTVTGIGAFQKVSICLPEHVRGAVSSISFEVEPEDGIFCLLPDKVTFVIDDLKLEADPSCGSPAFVIDGGFERNDPDTYWMARQDGGTTSFPRGAGARTGTGHARITQSSCNARTSLASMVTFPALTPGAGGIFIEAYYKATSATAVTYRVLGQTVTPAGEWTHVKRCIPASAAGRPTQQTLEVIASEECTAGTLLVDDVRVGLDPDCPG